MTGIILPPIIHDMVFKAIFTKRIDLLRDLLNTFPDFQGENRLVNLKIQQTVLEPDFFLGKTSILDLHATDFSGKKLIVEVQNYQQRFFGDRTLFYASRVFSRQLEKSEEYSELEPVYSINLLNFNLFPSSDQWYHSFRLWDDQFNKLLLTEKMKIFIIELPKLRKTNYDNLSDLEAWMLAIKEKNPTKSQDRMKTILEKYPSIEEAFKEYELLTGTEEFVLSYEAKRKAELDYNSILSTAKENAKVEGMEKGLKEGLQKGLQEGIEKGIQQGIEEGIQKGMRNKAIETALKLREKGLSPEEIFELTGLEEEEFYSSENT